MLGGSAFFRRPLIPVAASYALGAAVGHFHFGSPWACAYGAALAVALALAFASRRWRPAFMLAAAFSLAALRGALSQGALAAAGRDFAMLYDSEERVTVSGTVFAIYKGEPTAKGKLKHRFKLRDASFRTDGGWRRLSGDVMVDLYSQPPEKGGRAPSRGDRVEAIGNVHARRAIDPAAPALEDVRLVTGAWGTRILPRRGGGMRLARFRRDSAQILSHGIGGMPRERDLILAMTLGLRGEVDSSTLAQFRRAGTIHIFAISGLHVGVIALLLVVFLSCVGVPRTYVILPLAPMLAAYIYMTDMQPSAVRAALMVCIYYFAIFIGRRPDSLGSVSLALLVILAINPAAIAETGLVMSFTMVSGIILFTGPIGDLCRRAFASRSPEHDLRLAEAAEAGGDRVTCCRLHWRALAVSVWNFIVSTFAGALSASLVSFPLTAYIFHTFVPFSLLANVVVVPLALPVMAVSGLGLFLSSALPGLEYITNNVAAWFAWVVCRISAVVSSLPHASFRGDFPLWALVLWYAVLIVLLRGVPGLCGPVVRTGEEDNLERN